jgi:hypothetical protein
MYVKCCIMIAVKLEKCPKRVICILWTFKIAIIISAADYNELSKYVMSLQMQQARNNAHTLWSIVHCYINMLEHW